MTLRNKLFAGYFALAAIGLVWPGFAFIGNRVEPYILGLPLSLAWNVGWVLLTFVVLCVFEYTHPGKADE